MTDDSPTRLRLPHPWGLPYDALKAWEEHLQDVEAAMMADRTHQLVRRWAPALKVAHVAVEVEEGDMGLVRGFMVQMQVPESASDEGEIEEAWDIGNEHLTVSVRSFGTDVARKWSQKMGGSLDVDQPPNRLAQVLAARPGPCPSDAWLDIELNVDPTDTAGDAVWESLTGECRAQLWQARLVLFALMVRATVHDNPAGDVWRVAIEDYGQGNLFIWTLNPSEDLDDTASRTSHNLVLPQTRLTMDVCLPADRVADLDAPNGAVVRWKDLSDRLQAAQWEDLGEPMLEWLPKFAWAHGVAGQPDMDEALAHVLPPLQRATWDRWRFEQHTPLPTPTGSESRRLRF